MRLWLIGLVGLSVQAAPLGAADRLALRLVTDAPPRLPHPSLRIEESPQLPPMLPRLGMVVETEVLPGTLMGVGFVPIRTFNPVEDWQRGGRGKGARKPGVSVRLRF